MTVSVPTFTASIYVGQKRHYDGQIAPLDLAREVLQEDIDAQGLCVTLTPLEFIYTGGREPGFVVGLINYPRYPASAQQIRARALSIATKLLTAFEQYRVSVVFPDETVMLGGE